MLSEQWQALHSLYNSQIYEKVAEKRCVLTLEVWFEQYIDQWSTNDNNRRRSTNLVTGQRGWPSQTVRPILRSLTSSPVKRTYL